MPRIGDGQIRTLASHIGHVVSSFIVAVAGKSCSQAMAAFPSFPRGTPITDGTVATDDGAFAGTFQSTTTASGTFGITTPA